MSAQNREAEEDDLKREFEEERTPTAGRTEIPSESKLEDSEDVEMRNVNDTIDAQKRPAQTIRTVMLHSYIVKHEKKSDDLLKSLVRECLVHSRESETSLLICLEDSINVQTLIKDIRSTADWNAMKRVQIKKLTKEGAMTELIHLLSLLPGIPGIKPTMICMHDLTDVVKISDRDACASLLPPLLFALRSIHQSYQSYSSTTTIDSHPSNLNLLFGCSHKGSLRGLLPLFRLFLPSTLIKTV